MADDAIAVLDAAGYDSAHVMGASMGGHLIAAGHHVKVFSRTKAKAQPLVDRGATWAASPKEAVDGAEVAFSMVGMPEDVREVYLGESGILNGLAPGTIAVDMTST